MKLGLDGEYYLTTNNALSSYGIPALVAYDMKVGDCSGSSEGTKGYGPSDVLPNGQTARDYLDSFVVSALKDADFIASFTGKPSKFYLEDELNPGSYSSLQEVL